MHKNLYNTLKERKKTKRYNRSPLITLHTYIIYFSGSFKPQGGRDASCLSVTDNSYKREREPALVALLCVGLHNKSFFELDNELRQTEGVRIAATELILCSYCCFYVHITVMLKTVNSRF